MDHRLHVKWQPPYFMKAMSSVAYYVLSQNTVVKSWTSLASEIETRRIWKCSEKS